MQFKYKDRRFRIQNEGGTLWAVIACKHGKHIEDVARMSEFGEQQSRYIEAGFYGIWSVLLPGETMTDQYHYTYEGKTQPFTKAYQSIEGLFDGMEPTPKDLAVILKKYPDFKWVLAKKSFTAAGSIMKILDIWRNNARMVETLLSMHLDHIALNRNFYSATNAKEILQYLSRHPESQRQPLENIRMAIKYGVDTATIEIYKGQVWRGHHVTFEEWQYLQTTDKCKRKGIHDAIDTYVDYIQMVKRAGHNLKDKYWRFPKALVKQHDKVMKEVQGIIAAEQAIYKAQEAERKAKQEAEQERRNKTVYEKFPIMMKPLSKMATENGKYTAYIPQDVATVKTQAEKLNQCLITCNYIAKVVKKKCLLVFIAKAGKPFATAELECKGKKYRLGQFHGNQNLTDWDATPAARKTLDAFIAKNKLQMIAA